MSVDNFFEIPVGNRTAFIERFVMHLPEQDRDAAKNRTYEIVNNYEGLDTDALSVLAYAAERRRFEEFARKLDDHYQKSLQFVHPEARRFAEVPGAIRAERFFLECYNSLGIKPSNEGLGED